MSLLKEELVRRRELLESYWDTTSSVGIVLLDPSLKILDCNQGFKNMFQLQEEPIGLLVTDFLELGASDLKQSGDIKIRSNNRAGVVSILNGHAIVSESGLLLFCERLLMTESRAMEQIGVINNELINLQREAIKKNLLLEKLRGELDERIAGLEATLARVKQLEGLITICMYCKKIRGDQHSWHKLEHYLADHSDAKFSHGLCPHCVDEQMEKWSRIPNPKES